MSAHIADPAAGANLAGRPGSGGSLLTGRVRATGGGARFAAGFRHIRRDPAEKLI